MKIGGEDAALERLIQSAAAVVPLSVMLATVWASHHLGRAASSSDQLLARIAQGAGLVILVLNGAAWWSWLSAARRPPFAAHAPIPRHVMVWFAAWWVCAGAAAYVLLHPGATGSPGSSTYLFVLALAALLPWTIAASALTQIPETRLRVWRRYLRPTMVLSASLGGLTALSIASLMVKWLMVTNRFVTFLEGIFEFVWMFLMMFLLAALATGQLILLVNAADGARGSQWRGRLRRAVRRRAWVGAVALPVLLTAGMISSIAVSSARGNMWRFGGDPPRPFVELHVDAARQLAERIGESAESAAIYFSAVVGIAGIWIVAAFLPWVVTWRTDSE